MARGRAHAGIVFAVLATSALAYALLQSMVAPALPAIQRELGASTSGATWIITAYLLSASVATPVAGRIGDMFGKRRTLLVVLAMLAVGTAISALATSVGLMIVGRVVQGLGGAIFPLSFAMVRDVLPPRRVGTAISILSAVLGIGAGAGIVLAGPIVDGLSYHWLFWLPMAGVIAAFIAAALFVPESATRAHGRLNVVGAVLLAGWLSSLLLAFSKAADWGWTSTRFLGLLAVAAVLLAVWIAQETRSREPLVDMRMMRLRGVWTTNLASLLAGFGMFGSFILVPKLVALPEASGIGFGASTTQAGLFLLPSTVMMLLLSPLAGMLALRIGWRPILAGGMVFGSLSFVVLAAWHAEWWEVAVGSALMGIGIGLSFAAMANLIVEAVRPEQTGVATGMNTVMRSVGGSIGGQVTGAIVASSVLASGLPSESGFVTSFLVCAGAMLLGFGAALLVPRRAGAPSPAVEARPAVEDLGLSRSR